MRIAPSTAAPTVALPWVVRLRYAMALGQILAASAIDRFLGIDLPLRWIMIPPALMLLTNVWLSRQDDSTKESSLIGWLFMLDALCLTAILMLTGGPNNPFSSLYLVNITLAATILTRPQTLALGALSIFGYGSLFFWYHPIAALEVHHRGEGANLHLYGMWIGFGVASLLVAVFSGKISELLREREHSLLAMQEELARRERLASLATLAAGAAHELNTPLGTIAVAAKELERYATQTARDKAVAEDSRLIRTEVERCREILQRMAVHGAGHSGDVKELVSAEALIGAVKLGVPTLQLTLKDDMTLSVPRRAIEEALAELVKNSRDAGASQVSLSVVARNGSAEFIVEDTGTGIPPETLRHVGEPFFTTKEPGRGMGLGIFLVRTLAEQLCGQFSLESVSGKGTRATLALPVARGEVSNSGRPVRIDCR